MYTRCPYCGKSSRIEDRKGGWGGGGWHRDDDDA